MPRHEWPSIEGVVALVREHGQPEAARRLGVPRTTLKDHLLKCGIPAEARRQEPKALDNDVLEEIRGLLA